MAHVRSIVPSSLKPAARLVYHVLFRLHLRIRCWWADRTERSSASEFAMPPAMLRFRVSESLSGSEFLRMGEWCAKLVDQHLGCLGIDIGRARRVLDFGCGCGRTLPWFLREYGSVEFHGVDVDREAIEWCRKHLESGRFRTTSSEPPLPYSSQHFDIIYCFSVFTHLNEAMQDLWLAELRRLLAPGGVLLLTVHGDLAANDLDGHSRAALRAEGLIHRRSRKLEGIVPEWYQTTWHSREYIVKRLSACFEEVRYEVVPDGIQDIVMARTQIS